MCNTVTGVTPRKSEPTESKTMEQNTTVTTPIYWDGESALFMIDRKTGDVRILRESGFEMDRWYEEHQQATLMN